MQRIVLFILVLVVAILGAGRAWGAADGQNAYESLFGAQERRVKATGTTKDDAEFAAKLLAYARELSHERAEGRKLKVVLLTKAYELGSKDPAGQETALDAMKLLGAVDTEYQDLAEGNIRRLRLARFYKASASEKAAQGEELIGDLLTDGDQRLQTRRFAEAKAIYEEAVPGRGAGCGTGNQDGIGFAEIRQVVHSVLLQRTAVVEHGEDCARRQGHCLAGEPSARSNEIRADMSNGYRCSGDPGHQEGQAGQERYVCGLRPGSAGRLGGRRGASRFPLFWHLRQKERRGHPPAESTTFAGGRRWWNCWTARTRQ